MKPGQFADIFDAATHGDLIGVKRFVEVAKVPVTSVNENKETAAHLGARNGDLDIVRYLVEKNGSLLEMRDVFGYSCLHRAVENGTMRLLIYLLRERGVDIYEPNTLDFGSTPFHLAARHGHLHVLNYLTQSCGGDINVRNQLGEPPLFEAVEQQNKTTIKYFARSVTANLTMTDYDENNCLFVSARLGGLLALKYLTRSANPNRVDIDMNWRNRYGLTIACLAAKYGHNDFLSYIVARKNVDVNIADNDGFTPLHEAAIIGNHHMVGYLFRRGANLHAKDKYGKIPLDYATDIHVRIILENADTRSYLPAPIPRLSRSVVYESDVYFRVDSAISPAVESLEDIEDSDSFTHNRDVLFTVDNFLLLANIFFRYHRNIHNASSSLRSTVTSRIDPLAVNAVDNFED